MLSTFKTILKRLTGFYNLENRISKVQEETLLATGKLLSAQFKRIEKIDNFSDVEFKVFSQWGDDGILQWIFKNLDTKNPFFIEFGVQTYQESNTRFLLRNNNWSGLVIDGNNQFINYIKNDPIYWQHSISAVNSFITKENINQLLSENSPNKDIDLLSIDIDGNDYWIFNEINSISPKVIVCEYNGQFGDQLEVTIPYKKDFVRNEAHYSNLYFGCSIKSLISLGESKGYKFLGTNSNGNNAFFIRNDLAQSLLPKIKNRKIFLPKFRESRDCNGFIDPKVFPETLKEIQNLNLVDLKKTEINSIKNLYNLTN